LKDAATGGILAYFNTAFKTELIVDASPIGLGAILIHFNPKDITDIRIIAFASRTLSDVERRYSQIEKECLAIVRGCEKFHIYVYGRHFSLETDNKDLMFIFMNLNKNVSVRIERWSLCSANYDFSIHHITSVGNPVDYLSRKPLTTNNAKNEDGEHYINYLLNSAVPNTIMHEKILKATAEDEILQELMRCIRGAKFNLKRKSVEYDHVFHDSRSQMKML
jgi:hypothetical protein